MKVQLAGREILGSGSCVVSEFDTLNFIFDEVTPNIKIDINFIKDSQNSAARIESKNVSNTSSVLTLVNFDNQIGLAITQPWHILNLNGDKIFLRFACYSLPGKDSGGSIKSFHYTFFRGERS